MRNYLIKIALFFAIVAIVDFAFGKICYYLQTHTKGGVTGNIQHICKESNEDIIMMGSSRMRHHYVPQVFEDSLNMSSYNAGIDGNGIIMAYGFLEMILQYHIPKLIIYDINYSFDITKGDNTKYLDLLRPYYDEDGISSIFQDVDSMEHWKMYSRLYQYNSKLLGLVSDYVHPIYQLDRGYWPIHHVMNYEPKFSKKNNDYEIDPLKVEYIHKFISLARQHNVNLVFAVSPTYFGKLRAEDNSVIKELLEEEDVVFLDYYYDSVICSSREYWKDGTHMNDKGTRLFSGKLAFEIEQLFYKKQQI